MKVNNCLVLFSLFTWLLLFSGCEQSPQSQVLPDRQDWALSFVKLGTVAQAKINLTYHSELKQLADKTFSIGLYDLASPVPIKTFSMKNGDSCQIDLPAGSYRVKVENPANYSFAYHPGEKFELKEGSDHIYAFVDNSRNSSNASPLMGWEVYYARMGSPASQKPLAKGEVPPLQPGESYTINYNMGNNPNFEAGNYMFRLFNPKGDNRRNDCWSEAIYCPRPFSATEVKVSLLGHPVTGNIQPAASASPLPAPAQGTLSITKIIEGLAPADTSHEIIIKGEELALSRTIKSGQTISLKLNPGVYTVKEVNSGADYQVRQSPEGDITIKSNQITNLRITNIYPIELPRTPE